MNYSLHFHELSSSQSECIFEDDCVLVRTIPLKAPQFILTVFCLKKKLDFEELMQTQPKQQVLIKVTIACCSKEKMWKATMVHMVENTKITFAPHPVMKYAYCSDTAYHPPIIDIIHKADWLYHEATFLNQHNSPGSSKPSIALLNRQQRLPKKPKWAA